MQGSVQEEAECTAEAAEGVEGVDAEGKGERGVTSVACAARRTHAACVPPCVPTLIPF